ncbi:MAG: 5-3 exonuclease [Frankiales bacterium]|nr:5-3 exonuclease [Frankiales bacterium]
MPPADDPSDERVLLAVDGNSIVHRSFHSQAATGLRSESGRPLWAVRGLLTQLVAAVERIGPDRIVVGFDDPEQSLRRQRWPQYKANRTEKLATLVDQLTQAALALREMGIAVVMPSGLEADDVLAAAARAGRAAGCRTVIMTSDRDSFALIDDNTSVLRIINGGVEASPLLTPERLVMLLGVRAEQYRDFAALRGDPSDNLPGVRGIGPKTAARLLAEFGTARAAFDHLRAGGTRLGEVLGRAAATKLTATEARTAWELNCQVMAFDADLELTEMGVDLDQQGTLPLDVERVRQAFTDHQLTFTVPKALRVLAHHELDDAERVVYATARSWADRSDQSADPDAAREPGRWTSYGRSRPPKLNRNPERQTDSAQLALF